MTRFVRPLLALSLATAVVAYPCRAWADPGNGKGHGKGNGNDHGNGHGDGHGRGDGDGNGHGNGNGDGNGHGNGDGNGHGNGHGNGDGGGTGSGSGSGGGGTGSGSGGTGSGDGGGTGAPGSGTNNGGGGTTPGNGGPGTGNSPNPNGNARGRNRTTGQVSGSYVIIVRGCFATNSSESTGNTATVSAGNVSLSATVKDDAGHVLPFNAPNLHITDNYHFSGTGTVGGIAITLDGHVDPPDPNSPANTAPGNGASQQVVVRGRLECSYTTSDHHSGRVAGSWQPAPAAPAGSN